MNNTDESFIFWFCLGAFIFALLVSPWGAAVGVVWVVLSSVRDFEPLRDWQLFGVAAVVVAVGWLSGWQSLFPWWLLMQFYSVSFGLVGSDVLAHWLTPNVLGLGLALAVFSLIRPLVRVSDPDTAMLSREKTRLAKKAKKQLGRRPVAKRGGHSLVLGVSGSGKTAGINADIERAIVGTEKCPPEFVVIVDGKGQATDEYGMYRTAKELAKRAKRPFYVVVASAEPQTDNIGHVVKIRPYNPFKGLTEADAVKDAIVALVDTGSVGNDNGYYLAMFEAYALSIAKLMLAADVPVNFENVVKLMQPANFTNLSALVRETDAALADEALETLDAVGDDVKATAQRLATIYRGSGRNILAAGGFDLADAYRNNAVVMVLLDTFTMPSFSKSVAQLVINDLKTLVMRRMNGQIDMKRDVRVIFDEFAVYGSRVLLDIENKSRSAKTWITVSTQSFSDFDAIEGSDKLRRQFVDNTAYFYFYRVNDADSAEAIAAIIGTEKAVTQTTRSNVDGITADGSNTVGNEFKVPVDDIKEQADNHGVYYNKRSGEIIRFVNEFVRF